jgi:hypothetical protein
MLFSLFFRFDIRVTAALAVGLFILTVFFSLQEEQETAKELAITAFGFFAFALILATRSVAVLTIIFLVLSPLFLLAGQPALSEDISIAAFFLFALMVFFQLKEIRAGVKRDPTTPPLPS